MTPLVSVAPDEILTLPVTLVAAFMVIEPPVILRSPATLAVLLNVSPADLPICRLLYANPATVWRRCHCSSRCQYWQEGAIGIAVITTNVQVPTPEKTISAPGLCKRTAYCDCASTNVQVDGMRRCPVTEGEVTIHSERLSACVDRMVTLADHLPGNITLCGQTRHPARLGIYGLYIAQGMAFTDTAVLMVG